MEKSHQDRGMSEDLAEIINSLPTSTETPHSADALDDEEAETQETETPESSEEENQPETTHSDEVSEAVESIAKLPEEKRQEKIRNLEKSGRKHHLEAAKVLREMYGIEREQQEVIVPDEVIQRAIDTKLAELGITPDLIESKKHEQEKLARVSMIQQVASSQGVQIDASAVAKNIDFVKTFYDPKYSSLDEEERVLIAFNKVNKKVAPSKSQTGGVVTGTSQKQSVKKDIDSLAPNELLSHIHNMTAEDWGIRN